MDTNVMGTTTTLSRERIDWEGTRRGVGNLEDRIKRKKKI